MTTDTGAELEQRSLAALKRTFGFDGFRPLQREIVGTILARKDAFVLMPTGGGKSLCYQLPALVVDGVAVVVSPLIALMKDQVDRLTTTGVAATFINSSLTASEVRERAAAVAAGRVSLVYVAPERLMMESFLDLLGSSRLAYFAIDEAHCISEWGHDFRPEYRQLRQLRTLFPGVPLAAFTATATRRVQADIQTQLGLEQAATFRASFDRPNLYYSVRLKQSGYDQLRAFLATRRDGAGIVYCQSRATTDDLAERLRRDGFAAAAYHAGLSAEERRATQESFVRDDVRVVVATIAFGMGIDKPDVRFVVHYDLPKNLEGYYQESGRAGRDGEPSDCLLFYSRGDAAKLRHFVDQRPSGLERQVADQQLRQMVDWAETSTCRRRALLAYLDEDLEGESNPCCDNCRHPTEQADYTVAAQMLLSCVIRTGERFGAAHVIDVLRGSRGERIERLGHDRLSTHGIGRDRTKEEWQHVARELLRLGYLRQVPEEFNGLRVTPKGRLALTQRETVILPRPRSLPMSPAARRAEVVPGSEGLFEELRALRKRLADGRRVPPYVIFHDSTLRQMAAERPSTLAALARIQGVGERKLEDYGSAFLAAIAAHAGLAAARSGA